MTELTTLGEVFIRSAYQEINDANRLALSLDPNDDEGLETAFESYVRGSTFVTSCLLGPGTDPSTIPATFFGSWALVTKYGNDAPTVPWFVVAVALAWARGVGRMWIASQRDASLAQEMRTTLEELARHNDNTVLLDLLSKTSDEDLYLSIDHLLKEPGPPRNALDRSLLPAFQWVNALVAQSLPPSIAIRDELQRMETTLSRVFHQLTSTNDVTLLGVECIGPMRLIARLFPDSVLFFPTDETHAQALSELHERVLEQMRESMEAPQAAENMTKWITQHRQDVWRGTTSMLPATRILRDSSSHFSESASSYHPSSLEGSLAGERAGDFPKEEEEEGNRNNDMETEQDEEKDEEDDEEDEDEEDVVLDADENEPNLDQAMRNVNGSIPSKV